MHIDPDLSLRERLRHALTAALKSRDADAVSILRSALGAIDNAEAVEQSIEPAPESPIAGATRGLGAGDVPRRLLSEEEVAAIVSAMILELSSAAGQYERLGETAAAARARWQAEFLARYIVPSNS